MQPYRYAIFCTLLLLGMQLTAQRLEGIWSGKISRTASTYAGTESLEIQLYQSGKRVSGYTFAFKDTSRFVMFSAIGQRNKREKTLVLEERGDPFYLLPPNFYPCEKVFSLNYYKIGKTEYLVGKWTGVGVGLDTSCFPGEDLLVVLQKLKKPDYPLEQFMSRKVLGYFYRRNRIPNPNDRPVDNTPEIPEEVVALAQNTPVGPAIPAAPVSPALPLATDSTGSPALQPAAPLARNTPALSPPANPSATTLSDTPYRKPVPETVAAPMPGALAPADRRQEIQQILRVEDTLLRIFLYDNATVDDDTVTLFINKKPMLVKQRISNRPLVFEIPMAPIPGQPMEILMQAENLGSIPPNTALMVIECGKRRFEVRLSAGFEKHAVVVITYDP
jgi:hypothetical protein